VTARDILSRKLSVNVPTMSVAFRNAVSVTAAFGLVSIFTDWQPVSQKAALQLGAASVFIIGGYFCAVSAMRTGEIAVIAPFRYTSLLWALVLGLVVFAEWPDAITLIGAAIVVATGVYTFNRERRLRRVAPMPEAREAR
jgi:S-adenosylmethionine uptake transporter